MCLYTILQKRLCFPSLDQSAKLVIKRAQYISSNRHISQIVFVNYLARRRHDCVFFVLFDRIFQICSLVFTPAIGFHENNTARHKRLVHSFFIVTPQHPLLMQTYVVFYRLMIHVSMIEKNITRLEFGDRVESVVVLRHGVENFIERVSGVLFSNRIGHLQDRRVNTFDLSIRDGMTYWCGNMVDVSLSVQRLDCLLVCEMKTASLSVIISVHSG